MMEARPALDALLVSIKYLLRMTKNESLNYAEGASVDPNAT